MPSPTEKLKRADSLYSGPAGSSLGASRVLYDGTIDRKPEYNKSSNYHP